MIEITATAESYEQAQKLLNLDINYLYIGDATFGLRLPNHFSREEIKKIVELTHKKEKKVRVAVNAIMHPKQMGMIPNYLDFLEEIGVDEIVVGDPGVIHVLRRDGYHLPYIYDAQTMVTSSRQINFWGARGAIGAVLAREIPYLELVDLAKNLSIFGEFLVYGATCIHQSKRPLLKNYFNFTNLEKDSTKKTNLYISEPKEEDTHYSIYEDNHGTHIFQTNDVNMMLELEQLYQIGLNHWKLDGIYTKGDHFVEITALFTEAKQLIIEGSWTQETAKRYNERLMKLHPVERSMDTGFYHLDPDAIK